MAVLKYLGGLRSSLFSLNLKEVTEGEVFISSGSSFRARMVDGKNDS